MKQTTFDFERIARKNALNAVSFPRGLGVGPIALKAILNKIADSGPTCFKKQETLADEVGCSQKTVQRAVEILESPALDLLCVVRHEDDRRANDMTINWQRLTDLADEQYRTSTTKKRTTAKRYRTSAPEYRTSTTEIADTHVRSELKEHNQPPVTAENDWAVAVDLLLNFGLNSPSNAAHAASALSRTDGSARRPDDVQCLIEYAKANKLGPGLVNLICTGKCAWPPKAEVAIVHAIAEESKRKSDRSIEEAKRKRAEAIEFEVVLKGRKFQAEEAAIAHVIQRRLAAESLESYQTWGLSFIKPAEVIA